MRRHTIGLIPSSQTLTCAISAASASAADEAVSMTGLVRFGARVTRPAYRRSPFPVAGTPDILMLSRPAPEWLLRLPRAPDRGGGRRGAEVHGRRPAGDLPRARGRPGQCGTSGSDRRHPSLGPARGRERLGFVSEPHLNGPCPTSWGSSLRQRGLWGTA